MSGNGQFGFDPEDFERVAREASEGLRDLFGQAMRNADTGGNPLGNLVGMFTAAPARTPTTAPAPTTTGEKGDGVWVIYTIDDDGSAGIDQVFATELDALRAHRDNVDPRRKVRFLPYGVSVGVLAAGIDPTSD